VHFNDSRNRAISGTEVYYKSPVSRLLADLIFNKVRALPGASGRFVKTANFRVLKLNEYPAVLVECGYLSTPPEGTLCATPADQEGLAAAIAAALIEERGKLPSSPAKTDGPIANR